MDYGKNTLFNLLYHNNLLFSDFYRQNIEEHIHNLISFYKEKLLYKIKKKFYVACLSETIENELMWSIYADGGRGYGLAYATDILKDDDTFIINKVKYMNNRPKKDLLFDFFKWYKERFNINHNTDNNLDSMLSEFIEQKQKKVRDVINIIAFEKNKCWKSEKEYRLLYMSQSECQLSYKNIKTIRPKAIYFGEFMSLHHKYILIKWAFYHGLEIYEIYSNNNKIFYKDVYEKYKNEIGILENICSGQ